VPVLDLNDIEAIVDLLLERAVALSGITADRSA